MKQVTAAFKAHLAQAEQKTSTCFLAVRKDGTVLGFTDHVTALSYNLEAYLNAASPAMPVPAAMVGSGAIIYSSVAGYAITDNATNSDMSVDNLEVHGISQTPAITEATLQAGVWDFAFFIIFMINRLDLTNTTGAIIMRVGRLGQVSMERNVFKAELHGYTKAYTRTISELTSPMCRAILFDARCGVNPAPYTFTGTISGLNNDAVTLYDTGRTEAGPNGSVSITAVSNANPGHVTIAAPLTLPNQSAVIISGVVGMALINTVTQIRNLTAGGFDLPVDTTNTAAYPPYVSGGTVSPMGQSTGYFDFGVISFTSGANNGISMEIKCSVPGQFTLQQPMPYVVAIGDTYSIKAGCDHSYATCKAKFSNVARMRAEPFLPGIDKLVQVGKVQ